jgi:hypothetical protein
VPGHVRLEVRRHAQDVVDDNRAHIVQPALDGLKPDTGALQPVGRADVEHEEPVEVADECLGVEVDRELRGVRRAEAAVAADVEVPALLGGDDAEVLAPGLGTLAGTAAHAAL